MTAHPVAVIATVIALLATVVGVALFVRAVMAIVGVIKLGRPTMGRSHDPAARWKTLIAESFGHIRMIQKRWVGIAHWVVFVAFLFLFATLVTAYGQLVDPAFALPIVGHWYPYEWITEALAWTMLISIVGLMIARSRLGDSRPGSRFFGSRTWQARYVEWTILGIGVCVIALRALEFRLAGGTEPLHYPLTFWLAPPITDPTTVGVAIVVVAGLKIIVSMAWFAVIGLHTTMGVAWHRFTAWPNIWFKRETDGRQALGALPPVNVDGKPLDFEQLEDLDEDTPIGVAAVEDFTWKGLLDFTSCTECGRCQDQCPAWHTDKPLSPKLLIMGLREHAYAKAPWLQAAEEARGSLPETVRAEAERPLVGATVADGGDVRAAAVAQAGGPAARMLGGAAAQTLGGAAAQTLGGAAAQTLGGAAAQAHDAPITIGADGVAGVIDPDVLWSCTSCGACVQQCPVDIEHVDHIMDLRRHQVMIAADYPSELNGLYKGLESKGNPWNMNARKRMEWAKPLAFDVPVVGTDVEDLTEVEYLFWVGCAGAYEDRAIKTTQAIAELLHVAGVSYAVLGNGETCTGDPARRSGNEFVFQQLAAENVATLGEAKATKVVTSCAHCLNTLRNEYPQLGMTLEVVHHTQLLNRLVREGALTPVAPPAGEVAGRTITYHDPCFLGRHNQVYDAPRELLAAVPGATFAELPRNRQTSFCCGAGGARMWMEEKLGRRINDDRTAEALTVIETTNHAAGATKPGGAIATGCPFCRVMLSDGVTAAQSEGQGEGVEVLDVAQLLLESVKREPATPSA